jgi:hypothetical protein
MGYVSGQSGKSRVLALQQQAGLGDFTTTITDALPNAYSDTSTITGLPLVWELAVGALVAMLIWKITEKPRRTVRRKAKRLVGL